MQSSEFTTTSSSTLAILVTDLVVDSHESPSVVKVTLRRAKTPKGSTFSLVEQTHRHA